MARKPEKADRWVGQRLRALREQRGYSLEAVGELLEVSQQQVSRYERGQHRLSAGQICRLACGFDVSVAWFFEGYQEEPAELQRIRAVVREDRGLWRPVTNAEEEHALLEAWRALPAAGQREAVVRLVESFALPLRKKAGR